MTDNESTAKPQPSPAPQDKGGLKIGLTKGDDFLAWWSQGLTLGLVRWDGTILQGPDVKRFADWWVHGFTLGFLTVQKPNVIEMGDNILEHIARAFTLSLVTVGGEPTTLQMEVPHEPAKRNVQRPSGRERGPGWHHESRRHSEAYTRGREAKRRRSGP